MHFFWAFSEFVESNQKISLHLHPITELRTLTALVQQPSVTTAMHTNSPPSLTDSISGHVDSSNHTPPLTPHSYTNQIPSPVFSAANVTPNSGRNAYMPYANVSQSQSMVEVYTSAAYSPLSSPMSYNHYPMPSAGLLEHDVKLEAMSQMHGMHHGHHQNQHQQMMPLSRSPSVEDEHDLQSQIMSRNQERPTVVNIKTELTQWRGDLFLEVLGGGPFCNKKWSESNRDNNNNNKITWKRNLNWIGICLLVDFRIDFKSWSSDQPFFFVWMMNGQTVLRRNDGIACLQNMEIRL